MSTHGSIYQQFIKAPTLRERALAAKRKEEEDREAAEAAYREKRRQEARNLLEGVLIRTFCDYKSADRLAYVFGTSGRCDDEFRQAYNAPTLIFDGIHFYLNLTDGLVGHRDDSKLAWDFLWAAILCSQCGQTAASVQVTPAHAGHDPMADLGTLFEMAGDPPMCGTCRPGCKGCDWGEEMGHTCEQRHGVELCKCAEAQPGHLHCAHCEGAVYRLDRDLLCSACAGTPQLPT